jgi:hypothetical protein
VYCRSAIVRLDRKQLNISERKEYRRILGPIYDNGKEYWRILTNKEIMKLLKRLTTTETVRCVLKYCVQD